MSSLILKIKEYSSLLQRWGLMLLILTIFSISYIQSERNTQQSQPYLVNYIQALSIAISETVYGSEQAIGYMKVHNTLYPLQWRDVDWGPEFSVVNNAITEAMHLENVASEGRHSTIYEGGLATYYKMALQIFGYRAESAFYLYWLLLAIPILIYLITFYKRPVLLYFLLLFVISLFAISQTQGVLIESIIRNRFFPLLAILPSFYLALIISGEHKRSWFVLVGVICQALILAFVVYVRPSAIYQLLFLITATILLIFLYKQPFLGILAKGISWLSSKFLFIFSRNKSRTLNLQTLSSRAIHLWPLAIVLVGYMFIRFYTLNPVFENTVTNRGCSWHMFYMGLAGHPDAQTKYNIILSDGMVAELVASRAPEWGYEDVAVMSFMLDESSENSDKVIPLCTSLYEEIVRDEFLKIFQKDPWFVISSYFHKLKLYFQVYINPLNYDIVKGLHDSPSRPTIPLNYYNFGVLNNLLDWPVIIALILGLFLVEDIFLRRWLSPLLLLCLGFLFALLIPTIYYPINNTIIDSALYLTIILLALFSGGVCYSMHFFQTRLSFQSDMIKFGCISIMVILPALILPLTFNYQPKIWLDWNDSNKFVEQSETSFYGQVLDKIIGIYSGTGVFLYQDKYYAIPEVLWPLDENILDDCLTHEACTVGNSQAEILELANQLPLSSANEVTDLIKTISTSSSLPGFGSELLLNNTAGPTFAWHSRQWPEFPQWVDLVFHQPVKLETVGLQAQIYTPHSSPTSAGSPNLVKLNLNRQIQSPSYDPTRAPRNVLLLGAEEDGTFSELGSLQLDFANKGAWAFQPLSNQTKKFNHYRLLFLDNYGDPEFITAQEIRLYGQKEKEEYQGFDIVWANDTYYASVETPWIDRSYEAILNQCQQDQSQCVTGNTLDSVKQQIDSLPAPPKDKMSSLVKRITTSSNHPTFGSPEFLFDNLTITSDVWHSDRDGEFPQWIEIEFQEPVTLERIGVQSQGGGPDNRDRAPHNVAMLAGVDSKSIQPQTRLTFDFPNAGDWAFQNVSNNSNQQFTNYRILIEDNHGAPHFVSIQELWLLVTVEKDYKGYSIIWTNGDFYVLTQDMMILLGLDQLNETNLDQFQHLCTQSNQCGITDTLKSAKQFVDQLVTASP